MREENPKIWVACCTRPIFSGNLFILRKSCYQFKLEQEFGNGIFEAVDWVPDGHSFALATSTQVDIYDSQALEVIVTIDTRQRNRKIASSPNGRFLAIRGADKIVQLWDIQSQRLVHSLGEKLSFFTSAFYTPASQRHKPRA